MAAQISQQQFQDILAAFNRISEWVNKNFTEVDFSVEFNDDSQNPVDPAFRIKTRLITTKNMDEHDQFLRKSELVIRKEVWEDQFLMAKWIKLLEPTFQRDISHMVNDWYARKKVEGTAR
jgi:hypothetical protein